MPNQKRDGSSIHEIETYSPAQTESLGRLLGRSLTNSLVIGLQGDLGAGKTSLTRGIVAGMGLADRVSSPTFTLVNEYGTRYRRLVHMDTYRLQQDKAMADLDLAAIGLDDWLDRIEEEKDRVTVLIVEWADLIAKRLPEDRLMIEMAESRAAKDGPKDEAVDHRRLMIFRANGEESQRVLNEFRHALNPIEEESHLLDPSDVLPEHHPPGQQKSTEEELRDE